MITTKNITTVGLVTVAGFIVGSFLIGFITTFINGVQHKTPTTLSAQAKSNTMRNAAINSCKGAITGVNMTADQQQIYCTCAMDSFVSKYGEDKVYNDTTYWNDVTTNGFNQDDTAILQDCVTKSGYTE